jgi:hypothetical protein
MMSQAFAGNSKKCNPAAIIRPKKPVKQTTKRTSNAVVDKTSRVFALKSRVKVSDPGLSLALTNR